jgi:hypothetical protein
VSVDSNGHLTCSNIIDVKISRTLNYCILPKTYERNQPIPFAAYNPNGGNSSIKVYASGETLIWSQTFNGNSIFGFIPAEVFTDSNIIGYVSFDDSNEHSTAIKVTGPNEPGPTENVLALIVLPKWRFIWRDMATIGCVIDAFHRHGITFAILKGSDANYEKVQKYARNKHIKYLYIGCTDGHYLIITPESGGVDSPDNRRTNFDLYDPDGGDEIYEQVVSIQREDYYDPNMAPSWCVDLFLRPLNSVALMGFSYLEFAYFDFCYSGRLKINASNQLIQGQTGQQGLFDIPHSDMSFALGMAGSGRDNFYQGWYDISWIRNIPIIPTQYQLWTQHEWIYLGDGEDLFSALYNVIQEQYFFGPLDPVNCYRLKGEFDLTNVCLRNW